LDVLKIKYLKILGLSPNANEEAIKKAYRKLVMKYHPDKNLEAATHEKFLTIVEAYEYLTSDHTEASFQKNESERSFSRKYNRELTPEEIEQRIQRAKDYAKIKNFKEQNINKLGYYQLKHSFINRLSIITAILSLLVASTLATDNLLLSTYEHPGSIEGVLYDGYAVNYYIKDLELSRKRKRDCYVTMHEVFGNDPIIIPRKGTAVTICYTPIFRNLRCMKIDTSGEQVVIDNRGSFYFLFWFYFISLILPTITLLFRGPNAFYIVFAHLTTYIAILVLLFFIINLITYVSY
jgi:hypothetical protein